MRTCISHRVEHLRMDFSDLIGELFNFIDQNPNQIDLAKKNSTGAIRRQCCTWARNSATLLSASSSIAMNGVVASAGAFCASGIRICDEKAKPVSTNARNDGDIEQRIRHMQKDTTATYTRCIELAL